MSDEKTSVCSEMRDLVLSSSQLGSMGMLGSMLLHGNPIAVQMVTDALQECRGCVAEAARKLQVPRRTLVRWITTVPGLKAVRDGARAAR
jgi:DNA-binding NtrC family response regulator